MSRTNIPNELRVINVSLGYAAEIIGKDIGHVISENHLYAGSLGSALEMYFKLGLVPALYNSDENKFARFEYLSENGGMLRITGSDNARAAIYGALKWKKDLEEDPDALGIFVRSDVYAEAV